MFRPLWAIFRELYTVEYDLVVKQCAVSIKQYVVRYLLLNVAALCFRSRSVTHGTVETR